MSTVRPALCRVAPPPFWLGESTTWVVPWGAFSTRAPQASDLAPKKRGRSRIPREDRRVTLHVDWGIIFVPWRRRRGAEDGWAR